MVGPGKPLSECTNAEIRALLISGSIICLLIVGGSFFFKRQPQVFLWFIRGLGILWLVQVWYRGLRELRKRKRRE